MARMAKVAGLSRDEDKNEEFVLVSYGLMLGRNFSLRTKRSTRGKQIHSGICSTVQSWSKCSVECHSVTHAKDRSAEHPSAGLSRFFSTRSTPSCEQLLEPYFSPGPEAHRGCASLGIQVYSRPAKVCK
jgi:hypothetical protein